MSPVLQQYIWQIADMLPWTGELVLPWTLDIRITPVDKFHPSQPTIHTVVSSLCGIAHCAFVFIHSICACFTSAVLCLFFHCLFQRIHALCYPELRCTYAARLTPSVLQQAFNRLLCIAVRVIDSLYSPVIRSSIVRCLRTFSELPAMYL